jgi:hypothetical protein
VDYSDSGVNPETLRCAPAEAMQFGGAPMRILDKILHADPAEGPVYMSKDDVSDGFYRVPVKTKDIPMLGVPFPTSPCAEKLVALPLTLPMGWTESPHTSQAQPKRLQTSPTTSWLLVGIHRYIPSKPRPLRRRRL